jgi:two-component system nitrate/nitrite response regulator NarP
MMAAACRTHIAVLCDDRLLRESLVQFLSEQSDFTLTTCEGIAWPAELCAPPPDIYLVDARTHHASYGVTVPHGAVVIFVGASEDDAWASAALSSGARGILTRDAAREDVVKAIRVVREGGIWARRRWLNACVLHVVGEGRRQLATRGLVESRLSPREQEVLRHAATGAGNKQLADELSISEATVKVHLTRIFQKLGVPGRAALAATYGRTTPHSQNHPIR